MKILPTLLALIVSYGAGAVALVGDTSPPLNPPPQDQGLPYTRSAHAVALAQIKQGIAVFGGSRYGYIYGTKVRLDEGDLLHAEAVEKDGVVYVPESFAALVGQSNLRPPPVPSDLTSISDRWVYAPHDLVNNDPSLLKYNGLPGVATITVRDHPYYSLSDIGRSLGLIVTEQPSGLIYVGKSSLSFKDEKKSLMQSVISLFDTPEKYADPDIAAQFIPTLSRQGRWTDHVKVTPEQLAVLNGPETEWPTTPKSQYDLTGFNSSLLGSAVPAPGVYPRVLFSPEDVPVLAARIKSTTVGKMSLIEMQKLFEKTWWDPSTSDGQVFQKLATGDVKGLEWGCPPGTPAGAYPHVFKGQKPGIYNTHIYYNEQCLTSMALYCLLTNDDAHGRQAATAIANYYKLREPLLDEINSISDSEYGSNFRRPDGSVVTLEGLGSVGGWRTHGGIGGGIGAHMDLGLALDFSGKWMTPEQKDGMRRFIAKATYGYRAYGQDGPRRWRDVNWVTWDLSSYLALASIEGLPGFDPEAYASETETVHAFCDFGIDDAGVIYESNGKTTGGLQFLTLAMTGMARRGDNCFGHPHIRKFLDAQVQSTSPTGLVVVNSGTQYSPYSRQRLSYQFLLEMKGFFPSERAADYLLGSGNQSDTIDEDFVQQAMPGAKLPLNLTPWKQKKDDAIQPFSLDTFPAQVDADIQKLRLPGPTYPGFVPGVLLDGDCRVTAREALNLPLDFSDAEHGLFSSYSDRTPQATWINMLVRPDHYLGAGHHHADAGMFHFSALDIDWFTQSPFHQSYEGKYFNLVQVDGHSEPESVAGNAYNARAKYLGAVTEPLAAAASADLTYAYSYRWMTQPPTVWNEKLSNLNWELEPDPDVLKMFAGTTRYKMRPWWPTPNYSNYIPTCRALFNPMHYVFRTTALVRGPHPYGVVIDDLDKDGKSHLYQWAAMLNGGVWEASISGLPANEKVLAHRWGDPNPASNAPKPPIIPEPNEPLLLVCTLGMKDSGDLALPLIQVERAQSPGSKLIQYFDRLIVNQKAVVVGYKVLLIPYYQGEPLPNISYDPVRQIAQVQWKDQADTLAFQAGTNGENLMEIRRGDQTLLKK